MSVAKRFHSTPLRYPGGKQKLTPFVAEILAANGVVGGAYAEPYAGGAGVAVELLVRGLVSEIHINDLDDGVYEFWYCVIHHNHGLRQRIKNATLSVEEWKRQKALLRSKKTSSPLDRGFALLYLNRVNRSGILNGGLIGGLAQQGRWLMDARFNKEELVRRVFELGKLADRIHLYGMDAVDFIELMAKQLPSRSLVYLDPPYYHKANRLYRNYYKHADHLKVRNSVHHYLAARHWIVSYDNTPEIKAIWPDNHPIVYDLQYSAAQTFVGKEFMAFSSSLTVPDSSSIGTIDKALKMRSRQIEQIKV